MTDSPSEKESEAGTDIAGDSNDDSVNVVVRYFVQ